MASIIRQKNKRRMLQFVGPDGKRKTVRLGKMLQKEAEAVKLRVEHIIAANAAGSAIDLPTAQWLNGIDDTLHGRLAAVGLAAPRKAMTVHGLLDTFLAANTQVKLSTRATWRNTVRNLREFFGDRQLRSITREDAEKFRQFLIGQKLAAATIARRLQMARQYFHYAVLREWIDRNPFVGVSHTSGNPQARQRYVTEEETARLIEAAPNWVWRTIIALSRYGGLRCPSEVLSLKLADLDWQRGAMTVTSPKTEHHGQGFRVVPMFARLRPYLEEAWDMAEEGQTHVIPENLYLPAAQGPNGWVNANLRTAFTRIIRKAGLEPWPRVFHALRASCESDLARQFPIATVCKWIGNTVAIAARHYIQVSDADFQRAVAGEEKALQNAQQYPAEMGGNALQAQQETPAISANCKGLPYCTSVQLGDDRLEPPSSFSEKTQFSENGAAKCAALFDKQALLEHLADVLTRLPPEERQRLLNLLQ